MVYLPRQTTTVRDGGTGQVSSATALPLIIGVCSGGVTDTLYQYFDPNLAIDTLGDGPAAELGAAAINAYGGALILKTASSTAAANSAVVPTRVTTSTGTITLSGSARSNMVASVRIKATGTVAVGKFDYTLDGGYTYSEELRIPSGATYVLPDTGITLTFVPGAGPIHFEIGDSHAFTSTCAHYTTTNLGAAITALLAQIGTRRIRKIAFAGKNATAAAAATMAAAAATHLDNLASNDYFARAVIDAGSDTTAGVLTSFASYSDDRLAVCYGDANIVSLNPLIGWGVPKVPALNAVFERATIAELSENLGRKASGGLRGVRAISHDEGTSQAFSEADRITTLRTYRGRPGYFVTNGFLKAAPGSDFTYWDWGCVIDEICQGTVDGQDKYLLSKLRALADGTGYLDPRDAERIESDVRAALATTLLEPTNIEGYKGHVSALSYNVDRANNFLATKIFRSTSAAVPLVSVEGIETTVGFARSIS